MSNLLTGLDKLISDIAGPLLFESATLTRAGSRSIDAETGQTFETTETEACQALVTDYTAFQRAQAGIPSNERKILVLGHGLSQEPRPGDRIMINGYNWSVIETSRDPAKATYECRSK